MIKKSCINVAICVTLVLWGFSIYQLTSPVFVSAAQSDNWASNQEKVEKPEIIDENSAYIIFSEPAQSNGISFAHSASAAITDELYSEQVEFGGIPCRQVYATNKLYLRLDESFADSNDTIFSISFDYWNYGGGGNIYLEYFTENSTERSVMTILKLGLDENNQKTQDCWYRVTICVQDLKIRSGKMANNADFRISSGAYNAFSRFEVKNLSRFGSNEFLGVYNSGNYEILQSMGFFDPYSENHNSLDFYSRQITREEAIVMMIKGYGMEREALDKNLKTSFTDISKENIPYIALAEALGVVESSKILNKEEPFTQKELIKMYMSLLSIDATEGDDIYAIAKEKGLIQIENLFFQPNKPADVDTLAGLSLNSLFISNQKTGYNPFTIAVESEKVDIGAFLEAGYQSVRDWLTNNTFRLPKNTNYDKKTGRTYYSVNFFGQNAAKSYYTMNCMSNDNKRIYFLTLGKYIMEYNIETEMCRYIDLYHGSGCLVTPLDNLWYINPSLQIIKMDLDTYEKEIVGALPEWQQNAWAFQVNNDESFLSCWFVSDGSGEIDNKKESRLPRYDIKKREWDLRYKYAFPETGQANPNHMCINPNPKYSNLYFFAHEGNNTEIHTGKSTSIPDRTWVLDFDTGIFTNPIKQRWDVSPVDGNPKTGQIAESGCHEAWSYDGEWLFNVTNMSYSEHIPVTGQVRDRNVVINMVRNDFTDRRYIPADFTPSKSVLNSGFGGNHAMISYNNRWFASDCQYSTASYARFSDLYLFDAETGETHYLARTPQTGKDPGHTHPQFSPNDEYVIFGRWSEDLQYAEFAWMDISDIITNPAKGGRYDISKNCEILSFDCNENHSVKTTFNKNGVIEKVEIPKDNYLYVNVKKELIESENTPAEINITYKDDTRLPMKLVYYRWHENSPGTGRNVMKENEILIHRTGTGKTITKSFKFDDICFDNVQNLGSDFRIGAVGTKATVFNVEVTIEQ